MVGQVHDGRGVRSVRRQSLADRGGPDVLAADIWDSDAQSARTGAMKVVPIAGRREGAPEVRALPASAEARVGSPRLIGLQELPSLSLLTVGRLTGPAAMNMLAVCRWPHSDGQPICGKCAAVRVYWLQTRTCWRCSVCAYQFSITSGTILANRKMRLQDIVVAAALFVGGAKGIAATQMGRYLGCQYKTAWILCHKFREALQRPDLTLSGEVQIDGCTLGGYRRSENRTSHTGKTKRWHQKKFNNRSVVTVAREPWGNTKAFTGKSEHAALPDILSSVDKGATITVDGGRAWNKLETLFDVLRVEHTGEFSTEDGDNTNWAESFFSLLRRMQYGIHHHIGKQYLDEYANELAWRQDTRAITESDKIYILLHICLNTPPSKKFSKYWQFGGNRDDLPSLQTITIGGVKRDLHEVMKNPDTHLPPPPVARARA
jgi:transposase-like protein